MSESPRWVYRVSLTSYFAERLPYVRHSTKRVTYRTGSGGEWDPHNEVNTAWETQYYRFFLVRSEAIDFLVQRANDTIAEAQAFLTKAVTLRNEEGD